MALNLFLLITAKFSLILPANRMALKDLFNSIARELLAKNYPFCLYRFPNETSYNLAVAVGVLDFKASRQFWIAPFDAFTQAKDIFLEVLPVDLLSNDLLNQVKALPAKAPFEVALAPQTTTASYFEALDKLLERLNAGKLQKAILSRVIHETKPKDFDLLNSFENLCQQYPQAFTHICAHPELGIWMGATPELLLHKKESKISIMALAGTQAAQGEATYQWRAKEIEEHQLVGQHIEAVASQNNCTLKQKSNPENLLAGRVVHLCTQYEFEANEQFDLKDFLKKLHPTPAVGGLPVAAGLNAIHDLEPYNRKYYCGFLGEINEQQDAHLFVNLRCMQVDNEKIAIFVGGGITAASQAEEEWQETILKSKTMVDVLQLST